MNLFDTLYVNIYINIFNICIALNVAPVFLPERIMNFNIQSMCFSTFHVHMFYMHFFHASHIDEIILILEDTTFCQLLLKMCVLNC